MTATIPDEACRPIAAYLWGKPIQDGYPANALEAARQLLAQCLPSLRRAWLDEITADLERMAAQYEADAGQDTWRARNLERQGERQWQVEVAYTSQQERKEFARALRSRAAKWRGSQS